MGQTESKNKIEEEFEIYRIEKDGNALLRSKKDNKQYLMRVVTCATTADMDRLKALLECRAQLTSQHILSLVEIKEKKQDYVCSIHYKMYLVLEYSFKNLAQEVRERVAGPDRNYFQESDLWSILYSCCTALSTLYSNGATHESLSADQIFINKDGFVKITEPLLFGLEKNHLEAMRTREQGTVGVHLSPQIIGCLDDQNFFYYDKEKSDIFVLAMIVVDLALLGTHYLYPRRKTGLVEEIQSLLERVSERYSRNFVAMLGQMLQMESRARPNLLQIIEKVEKYNNINEDFTVESESNINSNAVISERSPDRLHVDRTQVRLAQYQDVNVREEQLERTIKRQAVPSKGGQSMQDQSLLIKEPSPFINQQSFEGRVFASTPHHSHYNQTLFTSHHQYVPAATYYQTAPIYPNTHAPTTNAVQSKMPVPQVYFRSNNLMAPAIHQGLPHNHFAQTSPVKIIQVHPQHLQTPPQVAPSPPHLVASPPRINQAVRALVPTQPVAITTDKVIITNTQQNFSLYERSKSIDSIKVASNQASRPDLAKAPPQSTGKPSPYNIPNPKQTQISGAAKHEPIFTHQIPEVYNILLKNRQSLAASKPQQQYATKSEQEHVATPQFSADVPKASKFSSFKNYQFEVVSRFGEEPQSPLLPMQPIQLNKKHSHSQSEHHSVSITHHRIPPDPFPLANPKSRNFAESSAIPPNPFSGSTPFPQQASPIKDPFSNSSAGFANSSPIVSASFIPPPPTARNQVREVQSFNYPSSYSHLALLQRGDGDVQLEYVKQQIEERGRYQGYKHNGERNGHGILYFKDGGHYDGEWKDDKMHGFGKLYYENGNIAYQGHWQNDQFNGQGRVYNSEPLPFEEEFNYKDFSQLGNYWIYYQGQFKNDSKHGKGYIKLSNGEMFEGIFDHDMIEGNGIFYKRKGEIVVGFWIDNKLFLNQSYEHDKK